jgi:hypothetical protein
MTKSKEYDFNALLVVPSREELIDCTLDMWIAVARVCPKFRGHWTSGNTQVEWLYNERPEIARDIERRHRLFPESEGDLPLSYNFNWNP